MFGVAKTVGKGNADVLRYAQQEAVRTSAFDKRTKRYTYQKYGLKHSARGLTRFLKKKFYPHWKTPRRRHCKERTHIKLASSKALGRRVDRELQRIVVAGNKEQGKRRALPYPKKLHPLTQAIVDYWARQRLTPVAAQLPVQIEKLGIMTQADIIVQNEDGQLFMHEVKTGHVGLSVAKGNMKPPYAHVKCTKGAVWDLQRHFTANALREQGLPLEGSSILHAYEVMDAKTKEKRAVAKTRPRIMF